MEEESNNLSNEELAKFVDEIENDDQDYDESVAESIRRIQYEEMLQNDFALSTSESKINLEEENSSPDLFTLIDEDYKNEIFIQENLQNETLRELNKSFPSPRKEILSDSQRLDVQENISEVQNIVNETVTNINTESKIKKIVFFYENGKFEAFEP